MLNTDRYVQMGVSVVVIEDDAQYKFVVRLFLFFVSFPIRLMIDYMILTYVLKSLSFKMTDKSHTKNRI